MMQRKMIRNNLIQDSEMRADINTTILAAETFMEKEKKEKKTKNYEK